MCLLTIILPFFGSFAAGVFGRHLGSTGCAFLTVFCLFLSFLCSFLGFYEVALLECFSYVNLISWIDSELLNVDWGFLFDTLTIVMCCVVTFISTLVHVYSIEYMLTDPHLPRFMCYLSFFTSFMLILVTADNFVQLFVGWEGVGLCSYLLINFWFTRIQANKAAIKAMVINRIGDLGCTLEIRVDDIQSYLGSDRIDAAKIVSSSEESRNEAEHMVKTRDVETVNSAKIYKKRRASFKRKACQREKFASLKQKKSYTEACLTAALAIISVLSFAVLFIGFEILWLKEVVQVQNLLNQTLLLEIQDLTEQQVTLELAPTGEGYKKLIGIFLVSAAVALVFYLTISGSAPSADIADSVVDVAKILPFREESARLEWFIHILNDEITGVSVKDMSEEVKASKYIQDLMRRLIKRKLRS